MSKMNKDDENFWNNFDFEKNSLSGKLLVSSRNFGDAYIKDGTPDFIGLIISDDLIYSTRQRTFKLMMQDGCIIHPYLDWIVTWTKLL